MKKQCEANTPATTYSRAHQCLKNSGVKKAGSRNLCAHHRAQAERKS